MTAHTLVLLAHPDLPASRIHARLAVEAREADGVTVHDLSAASTDGRLDVALEQQLLLDHDHIVWQFPWYWYSVPAVLKAWMDQVLTYGFAYGQDGTALRGKSLRLVTSNRRPGRVVRGRGPQPVHHAGLPHPLEATAHLCGLELRRTPGAARGAGHGRRRAAGVRRALPSAAGRPTGARRRLTGPGRRPPQRVAPARTTSTEDSAHPGAPGSSTANRPAR